MKRLHLQPRIGGLSLSIAVLLGTLGLALAPVATAADDYPLPPGWPEQRYDAWMPGRSLHGGGGPTLTLLYLDVDGLNKAVAAQGPGWDAPAFDQGQPMLLWGGTGGGGVDSFRSGGGGAGGELRQETSEGVSSLSFGYGAAHFHYVLRPGVDRQVRPIFGPGGDRYPGGRLRFTVGGQIGFGGYHLRLTDKEDSVTGRTFPIHREASQSFVLLAPELGVEFSLTPFTNLRLSASYFYPVAFSANKPDPAIHPSPALLQNLAVSVGLLFGVF